MSDQGNVTPDAPTPDPRPRPQYGEYAPPGWVSPNSEPEPTPSPEPAVESTVQPAAAPPAPNRVPTWDRPVTRLLLGIGLFGALIGWMIGSDLAVSLPIALEQYGIEPGAMPEWLDAAGTALVLSHILLFLLAIALTIALRRAGRPAFWAPLATTVIAAIIFWSVLSTAIAPYADQLQP